MASKHKRNTKSCEAYKKEGQREKNKARNIAKQKATELKAKAKRERRLANADTKKINTKKTTETTLQNATGAVSKAPRKAKQKETVVS